MVAKKRKSKRVSLKTKYKIAKKVREHRRKLNKKGGGGRKRLKKDPGIPNLWPFKDQLLAKAEKARELMKKSKEDQKKKRAERRAANRRKARQEEGMPSSISEFMAHAQEQQVMFHHAQDAREAAEASGQVMRDATRSAFYRDFRKVVVSADVLLEVLDARDPIGCRCKQVEEHIMRNHPNKRIIYVLNKIDLVPRQVVLEWTSYLRRHFPTIVFKSSVQDQRSNLNQRKSGAMSASARLLKSSGCVGADALIGILKNYARRGDMRTSITVGVIGYPNVGKSSLINSLLRSKVCQSGSSAGVTRTTQVVALDKNLKLIDCPGIVFSKASEADLILQNAVNLQQIRDPVGAVELILSKCATEHLMMVYNIPSFDTCQQFLEHVAVARGRLRKGHVPNLDAAARDVLKDWVGGRIPFYTLPPDDSHVRANDEAAIVSGFSAEFSLDRDFHQTQSALINATAVDDTTAMHVAVQGGIASMDDEQAAVIFGQDQEAGMDMDMDMDMDVDVDEGKQTKKMGIDTTELMRRRRSGAAAAFAHNNASDDDDAQDTEMAPVTRKALRKAEKERRRNKRRGRGARVAQDDEESSSDQATPMPAIQQPLGVKFDEDDDESDSDDAGDGRYDFTVDFTPNVY